MPRPRQRATLEEGLKLDVNKLSRDGVIRPGAKSEPARIQWSRSGEVVASGLITPEMAAAPPAIAKWRESRPAPAVRPTNTMPGCCRHVAANLGQRTPFASELNIDNNNMGGTAKSSATRATTDGNGPRQAVATLHEMRPELTQREAAEQTVEAIYYASYAHPEWLWRGVGERR